MELKTRHFTVSGEKHVSEKCLGYFWVSSEADIDRQKPRVDFFIWRLLGYFPFFTTKLVFIKFSFFSCLISLNPCFSVNFPYDDGRIFSNDDDEYIVSNWYVFMYTPMKNQEIVKYDIQTFFENMTSKPIFLYYFI